ncbi:ABC transporter ATP-binding protein/permease [Patescibacteria group bacterium]|nr:ABC transporter ATP-binding protein/permease [Patescibacteria group bacterium]
MKRIEYPDVGIPEVLAEIWKGLKPQGWLLFLTFGSFFAATVIGAVVVPLYYKDFFDVLTEATDRNLVVNVLIGIIVGVGMMNAMRWALRRVGDFSIATLEADTMARLRQRAFEYLIRHSHSFFTSSFTGTLIQRVNRFARSLERLVDTIAFNLIPLVVTVAAAIIVTWHTEQILAYVIIGWITIFFVVNLVFSIWRVKYNIKVSEADSKTTGVLADIITNQNAVQLFAAYPDETERFRDVTHAQAKITKFTWHVTNFFDGIQAVLIFAAEFLIFYFAIQLWAENGITAGTFVLVQVYVIALTTQLWDFGRIIRTLYEIYADSKEMVEILALPHEIQDEPGARPLSVPRGAIAFDRVTFSFDGEERKVLDNVSLSIPGGQKVALVGPSGAGKTTFIRLLLRLFNVEQGSISVDGQNIRETTLESLHKNISMVPQDPVLFHRSLLENIRFGKPNATDDEVKEAARLAHCDEFIENLPEKYETYVGERGVKLSGGERQRVAIARAILKNAPILILDEATSSLDSRSEFLIQDALDSLMKGKTAILVAHRLSTIRKMDRIIVVNEGKIEEDGSHEELLKNPESLYRKLWELQAGGFILEREGNG